MKENVSRRFLSFYGKWKETVSVNRIQNFNQYQKLCSTFLQLKISSSPLQHHSADLCQNSLADLFMMEKSNKNFYFSDNYTQPTPENSDPNLILSLWSWSVVWRILTNGLGHQRLFIKWRLLLFLFSPDHLLTILWLMLTRNQTMSTCLHLPILFTSSYIQNIA